MHLEDLYLLFLAAPAKLPSNLDMVLLNKYKIIVNSDLGTKFCYDKLREQSMAHRSAHR